MSESEENKSQISMSINQTNEKQNKIGIFLEIILNLESPDRLPN